MRHSSLHLKGILISTVLRADLKNGCHITVYEALKPSQHFVPMAEGIKILKMFIHVIRANNLLAQFPIVVWRTKGQNRVCAQEFQHRDARRVIELWTISCFY